MRGFTINIFLQKLQKYCIKTRIEFSAKQINQIPKVAFLKYYIY